MKQSAAVLLLVGGLSALGAGAAAEQRIFVGTYSRRGSEGVYRLTMDSETGALGKPTLAARALNASFLAAHPAHRHLYAVNEIDTEAGKPAGAVTAFEVDADGMLREVSRQPTGGAAPCHLGVDASAACLVVANYRDGNAALFPIEKNGALLPMAHKVQHEGRGPNPQRQEAPHAHGVTFSPENRFVLIPDLGLDRIMIYRLDGTRLAANDPAFGTVAPGAGPRHVAFHPTRPLAYSINEMGGTVTAFAWDGSAGALRELCTVSTLPPDFQGANTTAEIVVHPSGRFLYGSNRGHDSIAVFALDDATGKPTLIQHQPTGGKSPRNFAVDPAGRFLIAANQDSDNLVVFRIEQATGKLSATGSQAAVPAPVCVLFW